jgi:Rieske Fe-S protein
MTDLDRRKLLAAALALPFVRCQPSAPIDGNVTPINGTATLSFTQFPKLASVGGGVVVETPNGVIVVIRTGASTAAALSAVCTHSGCTVEVQSSSVPIYCPCHGSEFTADGRVARGPANRPLASYPATVGTDGINVAI